MTSSNSTSKERPGSAPPLYRDAGPVVQFISPSFRVVIFVLAAIAAAVVAFMVYGTYSRYVELVAQVIPGAGHSVITVPQAGFVGRIWVTEGQQVKKGQPLFLVVADAHTRQGTARDISIKTIKDKRDLDVESMRSTLSLSKQKLAQLDVSEKLLRGQLAQAEQLAKAKHEAYLLRQADVERQSRLADAGYISESGLSVQRRDLATAKADWAEAEMTVVQRERELAAVQESRLNEFSQRTSTETQIKKELAGVDDETSRANLLAERVVVAPENGRIAGVTFKVGERVEERRAGMLLLPPDGKLVLAGYALGRDVGLIRQNSIASVRYDAFPYQKYGVFQGKTTFIAELPQKANDIDMPLPNRDEYYYKIEVSPEQSCVRQGDRCAPIKVGMTARLRIKTDTRTIIEWILDPLKRKVEGGA